MPSVAPLILLLAVLLQPLRASSQDALNGKRLYLDAAGVVGTAASCVDCHGGLPGGAFAIGAAAGDPGRISRAIDSIPAMAIFRGRLTDAQLRDLAAYIANPAVPSPDVRFGAAAPLDRIDFGTLPARSSRSVSVTLANAGALPVELRSAPRLHGPNAAEFALTSDCAPGPLSAGARCTVEVRYTAGDSPGARSAALRIEHDWVGGSAAIALLAQVETSSAVSPLGTSDGGGGAALPAWLAALLLGAACRRATNHSAASINASCTGVRVGKLIFRLVGTETRSASRA